MLTMSPTGSKRCLPSSPGMVVEALVEDEEQEFVTEEAEVLADLAAAAAEQAARTPVVERLLGELQQFRGLVDRQHRWEPRRPQRLGEGGGHVLGGPPGRRRRR